MTTVLVGTNRGLVAPGYEPDGRPVLGFVQGADGAPQPVPARDDLTCIAGRQGEVWAGTREAHLRRGSTAEGGLELVPSFDQAKGRDEWYTPWGGPPDVRSIALDPHDGTVYVNVHVGGIPRSRDGGTSWEPTIDLHVDVHQVIVHDGLVLAACGDEGLALSADGGDSWRIDRDGLHASYCRAVAVAGDHVLVSASTGPSTSRSAVYRRPLRSSGSFERCAHGLPEFFDGNIDTFWLAGRGASAAFATKAGDVYLSEDEGATWHDAGHVDATVTCLALVSAPPRGRASGPGR